MPAKKAPVSAHPAVVPAERDIVSTDPASISGEKDPVSALPDIVPAERDIVSTDPAIVSG